VRTLADAMLRICADPNLIATMGAAARRTVEERYSVEMVNRLLLSAMGMQEACPDRPATPVIHARMLVGGS